MTPLRNLVVAACVAVIPLGSAAAQIPGAELTQIQVTREALQDLLRRLEDAASSGTYSGELRSRAREMAGRVRARLEDGDFQAGDRVYLQVEAETVLTDTFMVRGGRMLDLPGVGPISLQGVLRSELSDHLARNLGQFLRNPRVRAQALVRITVMGAVARQGFYTVPVDIPVNDVLMAAGGPASTAMLDRIRIERGNERLFEGEQVERIITLGLTLDALGIQAGDRIDVPASSVRNPFQIVQTVNLLLTLPITLYGLVQLVKSF